MPTSTIRMHPRSAASNLSQAIMRKTQAERNLLENDALTVERSRNNIRLRVNRHMEAFVQLNRKRHDAWHRYDRNFREVLQTDKNLREKRKQHYASASNTNTIGMPPITVVDQNPQPMTKIERQTYRVLQASQKLLEESAAQSRSNHNASRPVTSSSGQASCSILSTSYATNLSSNVLVPTTQLVGYQEYDRLMNESLKQNTYCDFVEHFVKFCPEFRESFLDVHRERTRQMAVAKLRQYNQLFTRKKDHRYHNLIDSLADIREGQKQS